MEIAAYIQIVILLVIWIYLERLHREIVKIRKAVEADQEVQGEKS